MLSPQVENFGMEIGPGGIIDKPYIHHQIVNFHMCIFGTSFIGTFPQQKSHIRVEYDCF